MVSSRWSPSTAEQLSLEPLTVRQAVVYVHDASAFSDVNSLSTVYRCHPPRVGYENSCQTGSQQLPTMSMSVSGKELTHLETEVVIESGSSTSKVAAIWYTASLHGTYSVLRKHMKRFGGQGIVFSESSHLIASERPFHGD